MNSGVTSERVYDALKRRLLAGELQPGEKLEPARFADELNSSVTPVRDALHRLAGERLVETRVSDGFHLPLVSEPGLRDLYRWNAWLTRAVVADWPRTAAPTAPSALPIDLDRATAEFFRTLARRARNTELLAQVGAMNDRLASARIAEAHVLSEPEAELRALAVLMDTAPPGALTQSLAGYHRRRERAAPAIVRALYRR